MSALKSDIIISVQDQICKFSYRCLLLFMDKRRRYTLYARFIFFKKCYGFNVGGLRKHVEGRNAGKFITVADEIF